MTLYTIRASRQLRLYFVAVHLLALIALLLAELHWGLRVVGLGSLAVSLLFSWPKQKEERLRHAEKGDLQLWQDEDWHEMELLDASVVQPWLTMLSLRGRADHRKRHLVILRDSLDADEFRRLRVWVKWKGLVGGVNTPKAE